MSDLISRAEAIDALKQLQKNISGDYTELDPMVMAGTAYIGDCIVELQDLPSAELPTKCIAKIEVDRELLRQMVDEALIRCKDCEWWEKQNDNVQGRCELMQMYPAGGWYCGNAQRRENNEA